MGVFAEALHSDTLVGIDRLSFISFADLHIQ